MVHAYNCTRNEVTGFSPYELIFGRQPRLPVDLAFNLPINDNVQRSHSQYVRDLRSQLEQSYQIATRQAQKSAVRNKARFDKHITASRLEVGDRVLVRNVRLRGKHKLADKWEPESYVVVKKTPDLLVYTVRSDTKEGLLRTLHRDLLLPCGFLPIPEVSQPVLAKPASRPKTRLNPGVKAFDEESQSDGEDEDPTCWLEYSSVAEPVQFPTVHNISSPGKRMDDSMIDPAVFVFPNDANNLGVPCDDLLDDTPDVGLPVVVSQESDPPNATPDEDNSITSLEDRESGDGTSAGLQDAMEEVAMEDGERGEGTSAGLQDAMEEVATNQTENTSEASVRRSTRQRMQPDRLAYSRYGNPLISVVQSLFHGLSTALINSLEYTDTFSNDLPGVVTVQPLPTCTGTCMTSRGECVTQGN